MRARPARKRGLLRQGEGVLRGPARIAIVTDTTPSSTANRDVRALILLWLAGTGLRITLLAVPPVIPLIHSELHLTETEIGTLGTLPSLLLAAAAIPGSALDRAFRCSRCAGDRIVARGLRLRRARRRGRHRHALSHDDHHRGGRGDHAAFDAAAGAQLVAASRTGRDRGVHEWSAFRRDAGRRLDPARGAPAGRRLVAAELRLLGHSRHFNRGPHRLLRAARHDAHCRHGAAALVAELARQAALAARALPRLYQHLLLRDQHLPARLSHRDRPWRFDQRGADLAEFLPVAGLVHHAGHGAAPRAHASLPMSPSVYSA